MKDKILICIIIILVLALFVETAYILQLKFDKEKTNLTSGILNDNPYKRNPYTSRYEFDLSNPFDEIRKLQNKIFNYDLFEEFDFGPNIKMEENKTHYIVKVYSHNIEKSNIKLEIEDNSLIISGEHNIIEEKENKGFYKESANSFQKVIPLPGNVKIDEVTTEYKKDLLIVKLPKLHNHEII